MTKKQLESSLSEFPTVTEVVVDGNGKLVAKMMVTSFRGVDEAERQAKVWGFLRKRFREDDIQTIEFILTNAPGDPD